MFPKIKNQEGFSIVEMLVAVSILLLIIVGPMTITVRTAKSASFATEQVQAFFFAQEGLEIAQKLRDDLLLRGFLPAGNGNYLAEPWNMFWDSGGPYRLCYAAGCGLEWGNTDGQVAGIVDCSTLTNCLLKRAPTTNQRSHFTYSRNGNVTDTLYTRQIVFTQAGVNAVRVRSIVTWRTGSIVSDQKVEVETYLYNIYGS